jgi:hypothetical protein
VDLQRSWPIRLVVKVELRPRLHISKIYPLHPPSLSHQQTSFLHLGSFQRHLTTHHSIAVAPSATSGSLSLTRVVIIGSVTVREPGKLRVTGCYKLRLSELSTSTSTNTSVMSHATSLSLLSYSLTVVMSDCTRLLCSSRVTPPNSPPRLSVLHQSPLPT